MKYTFQHYLDISTSGSSLQLLKIKAGGEYVRQRCKHLFGTYKYFKLGKVEAKLLPVSSLPIDPAGISMEPSDPNSVDPRDQMNPGLVRITNGEDILESFTGLNDTQMEQMYINTMLDPRWSKFMLQSGFRRKAYPLYWNVGNLHQNVYPDSIKNLPQVDASESTFQVSNTGYIQEYMRSGDDNASHVSAGGFSHPGGLFQVGHRGKLGWMPIDAYEKFFTHYEPKEGEDETIVRGEFAPINEPIPAIDCITIILPKAHKTLYYYRLFITETVYFSGIKNVGINASGDEYRAVDNFTWIDYPMNAHPWNAKYDTKRPPLQPNNGNASLDG